MIKHSMNDLAYITATVEGISIMSFNHVTFVQHSLYVCAWGRFKEPAC